MMDVGLLLTALLVAVVDSPVRAWVDATEVVVESPFWIHVEATGTHLEMPETVSVSGLAVDPINIRQTTVSNTKEKTDEHTTRRSFYARALRPGTFIVPRLAIKVNGAIHETEEIELRAVSLPNTDIAEVNTSDPATGEPPSEDLVFIDMQVDRHRVYQGEPIYFRTQLWRVVYRNIDSGPYRESRIEWPTTQGFFVRELSPVSFVETRPPWNYDVWEERMILFPTVVGEVSIGRWHWEGVALIEGRRRTRRQRRYFDLDVGPILIDVRPIPQGPPEFTGSVGQFECALTLDDDSFVQGVPTQLTVTVSGSGNPHAMGDPSFPNLRWAQVDGPIRESESKFDDIANRLRITNRFRYTLTPLVQGRFRLEGIAYTYFDPEQEKFVTKSPTPVNFVIRPSAENWRPMVVADDVPLNELEVGILTEDIRPLLSIKNFREAATSILGFTLLLLITPIGLYLAAWALTRRDTPRATIHGPPSAARLNHRLEHAASKPDPFDTVYQTLVSLLAADLDVHQATVTSVDARAALHRRGVSEETAHRFIEALELCERARYASEENSEAQLYTLVQEAKQCVADLTGPSSE